MATLDYRTTCELNKPVKIKRIDGLFFSQDVQANRIVVSVVRNGVNESITGTISANIIRADGETVVQAGEIDGNIASVKMPAAAYAVPGAIAIFVKLVQNGATSTIAAVTGYVYKSTTDVIVDPGTILPSIQDLLDSIDEAVARVEDVTEEIDEGLTAISAAGTTQVGNVNTAGTTQVAAVQAKGAEVLESIPSDYSELADDVSSLKDEMNDIDSALFDNDVMQPIDKSELGTVLDRKSTDLSNSTDTTLRIVNNTGLAICYFPKAEKAGKVYAKSIDTTHNISIVVTKLVDDEIVPATGAKDYPIIGGYTSVVGTLGDEINVPEGSTVIVVYNRSYSFTISGNIYKTHTVLNENVIEQVQEGFSYDEVPTEGSEKAVNSGALYNTLSGYVSTAVVGIGKNKFDKNNDGNQDKTILSTETGNTYGNNSYYTSYFIPVTPGKPYVIYAPDNGKTGGRAEVFYDDEKAMIPGSARSNFTGVAIAPEGAAYYRFTIISGRQDYVMLLEDRYYNGVEYEEYTVIREIAGSPKIPEELSPFFIRVSSSKNQYNKNGLLLNSEIRSDGYRDYHSTYFTSNIVYCGGYDVLITGFEIQEGMTASTSVMTPRNIAFYDAEMNFITIYSGSDWGNITYLWDVNGFSYVRYDIPSGAYYVIVGYASANTEMDRMIYCANGVNAFPLYEYEDYEEAWAIRNDVAKRNSYVASPFDGKTLNVIGDSITYGYGTYTSIQKAYPYLTGYKLNMAVNNYGINSSELAERSPGDGSHNPMCIRYADMANDADVIIVAGGTNDWGHSDVILGQMGDTSINTFYGALDTMCKGLLAKYPGKYIAFMTPIKRMATYAYYEPNGLGYTLAQFADAIKEVCAFYGIPVLDMFEDCSLNTLIQEIQTAYFIDGTHPNQAGHMYIASMVAGFIASLAH